MGLTDAAIILVAGFGVYATYVGFSSSSFQIYSAAIFVDLIVTIGAFYVFGLYEFEAIADPYRQIPKILGICGTVFLILVSMAFSLKVSAEFSRVWSFATVVMETILIYEARAYFHYVIVRLAKEGKLTRRIAIVGAGVQGQRLAELMAGDTDPWIRVVGIFDDRTDRVPAEITHQPLAGDLDELIHRAREERIDEILLALPWSAEDRLWEIVEKLKVLPADIRLSPDMIGLRFRNRSFNRVGDVPCLSVFEKPISDCNYVLKLIEDKLLGSIILLLNLPLLGIIALAIKLDSPGPVLFKQNRYGFNNELFEVFKFRTMFVDRPLEEGVPQATRNDPRVAATLSQGYGPSVVCHRGHGGRNLRRPHICQTARYFVATVA